MEPELVADYACTCGEGPLWHPDEQAVYWVDIPAGRLFRFCPTTGRHEQLLEGDAIGGFTIQADGSLLLFMAHGAVKLWRSGLPMDVIPEIPPERSSRFNDVIADPQGRVFCGTMPTPRRPGRLYRLDPDLTLNLVLEDIGCSNGMGFTPDRRGMYYTDSTVRRIYLFDYDEATGELANQRVFVETPEGEGVPDGMTVDAEGFVWTAKWDGGCVVRYDPEGVEERRVAIPAPKASCVTFGGEDYADAYVTTAGGHQRETDGPVAGALFRVDLGVAGVPEFRSRIGLG